MRWFQDDRGFDSFFVNGPHGGLLGGAGGSLYSVEEGMNDAGIAIPLRWISRFHDQGGPNNLKTYQDIVVDFDTGGTDLTVVLLLDNGETSIPLGSINSTAGDRNQRTFQVLDENGEPRGRRAKNAAVMIEGTKAENQYVAQLYGVFLHWYPEARGALDWDSDEQDAGTQKVKAFRALEMDLENPGPVVVQFLTDMPGNAMVVRGPNHTIPASVGRRPYQVPLGYPYIEGRRFRVLVVSGDGQEFMLYPTSRVEFQIVGEYVEGYEAAAGRRWDSGTLDLGTPHVKEIREVQLDIDTDGALTFDLHTELPGLGMATRSTKTVNTETTTTRRRMVNLPLLAAGQPVEGRLVQMFLSGSSAWRLYGAWLFVRAIGYYVEAYQAQTGHIWDSTVLDLGSPLVKRILQLYFEAHADSPLTVTIYTSNANGDMVQRDQQTIPASAGRKPYIVALEGVYGRLALVTISSTAAFRLFHAKMHVKPIGVYLNAGSDEVFPVESEQDFGSERVKLFKEIEVVYDSAASGATLEFHTDLPDGTVTLLRTFALTATAGTETRKLRLPSTAKGRLIRAEFRPGSGDLAVFSCRVWTRVVGESGEAKWAWVQLPIPATPDNYAWADLYVAPTPPAWEWVPIYVPPTDTPKWDWVDLPVKY